jgi:signal transduction histidine kinase/ActR/RegA family two-component response regulator
LNHLSFWLGDLLSVRNQDPELRRRGRLLGILLLTVIGAVVGLTLVNVVELTEGLKFRSDYVISDLAMIVFCVVLLRLNQIGRTRLAATIFLISLIVGESFLFTPPVLDRITGIYVIPTMGASFLLGPASSFIFATFSLAGYAAAYWSGDATMPFNYVSFLGLYAVAVIAWLAAANLESAVRQVRQRAAELDQRVLERTSDLAEALQREHAEASKTQAVLQSIDDGVIVFDQDRQAIVANPAVCAIAECDEAGVLGHDISAVMGKAVSEEDQAVVCSLIEGQGQSRTALKVAWGRKIVAIGLAPVKLPSTDRPGTVMVLRDITREAEVDRMKSEFVSMVSHELRTPMTAIKGYLELFLMGAAGSDPAVQRNFLEVVKSNADRLSDMVDELLDMSRIEAGKVQMHLQAVSVQRIVCDVAMMLQKGFDDRNLPLCPDIPDDLPDVLADPGRLTQIVTNLLSNALKYTFEGRVDVIARVVGDHVQVDVADTGIGMTEEDQTRLFTRFFRASTAREKDVPGTGLGLSITRSLIEMHGGYIWVKSAEGQGSTFSFTLPIMPASLAQMAPPEAPLAVETRPRVVPPKILVVDDEPNIAQLFRHLLEKEGHTVVITGRGLDVLPLARREQPDLILLDLILPDADGFVVLNQLKQDPATRPIPVVVTSIVDEKERGLALGAAEYLVKPISDNQLLSSVQRALVIGAPASNAP